MVSHSFINTKESVSNALLPSVTTIHPMRKFRFCLFQELLFDHPLQVTPAASAWPMLYRAASPRASTSNANYILPSSRAWQTGNQWPSGMRKKKKKNSYLCSSWPPPPGASPDLKLPAMSLSPTSSQKPPWVGIRKEGSGQWARRMWHTCSIFGR